LSGCLFPPRRNINNKRKTSTPSKLGIGPPPTGIGPVRD
jgi:hypothetical protein